jgi:hypothetical protein
MSATLQASPHGDPAHVDHPGPSVVLVALYAVILAIVAWTWAVAFRAGDSSGAIQIDRILASVVALILAFHLWQISKTYYTLSGAGIEVRYGPWTRLYPWTDFVGVSAKRGLFATRIGWPSVTPCVRMWNGVVLKRRRGFFGPIVLAPEANQGPLLGIFITGPLGFLLGFVLGYGYAALRERPETTR